MGRKKIEKIPEPPLTNSQMVILEKIKTFPPLCYMDNPEHYVRRITAAYPESFVLNALREILAYCASHPKWEAERSNGNMAKTITRWLHRTESQQNQAGGVKSSIAGGFQAVPKKDSQNAGIVRKSAEEVLREKGFFKGAK